MTNNVRLILLTVLISAGVLVALRVPLLLPHPPEHRLPPAKATSLPPVPGDFAVPPPPFSPEIFPCSQCHNEDQPTNKKRRKLKMEHKDIVLQHDQEHRWCLDCHDSDNRDQLRSASGEPIKFEESFRLCGQCHGDKLRDWRIGIHGKRTGEWNGKKEYLLCVHCHNPHSPKFKPVAPMPPPVRPEQIR